MKRRNVNRASGKKNITVRNSNRHLKLMPAVILIAAAVFIISVFGLKNVAKASQGQSESVKYYTTITISSGDTLWSIAKENMGDSYSSVYDYIDEIMQINMLSSDSITSGQHLVIPCFYK